MVDYLYDSGSRMLQRTEGTTTTNFHWDGWDLVREEKDDGTDVEVTNYLVPHGEVMAFERDGDWFYLHGDGLSSTQLVTDSNGDQAARMVYGAWGETLSSNSSVPGSLDVRFVGGLGVRNDNASGLIYMRHRWYDAQLGRFISRDPIGHSGGVNLYEYPSNPLSYIDPIGLKKRGVDTVSTYGVPDWAGGNQHPVWKPRTPSPMDDPNYKPGVPYLPVTKPMSVAEAWDKIGGNDCPPEGQRCFLVCTTNVIPARGMNFRHAFLVFGPSASKVWGLWQGNKIGTDPIKTTHWNVRNFRETTTSQVRCRMYCDDTARVDNAERIAQAGAPYLRTYVIGESNLWVRLVLQTAGISKWKGYDIWFPAP